MYRLQNPRSPISILVHAIFALIALSVGLTRSAHASCGATTCFVIIGSQSTVPQKGVLTMNTFYEYVPQRKLNGTTGIIPGVEIDSRELVLNDHREARTINQTYTLDLNYGLTDRVAVELTIPYTVRLHRHVQGLNTDEQMSSLFTDNGLGDIRVLGKYRLLSSLSSMFVLDFGMYLPTGKFNSKENAGNLTQEPGLQLGRGNVRLVGGTYQTYTLIPNNLTQFSSFTYQHTFRNDNGYQFGDQYQLTGGLSYLVFGTSQTLKDLGVSFEDLILTAQFNWRYRVHDNFSSSLEAILPGPGGTYEEVTLDPEIKDRRVPTSGSTTLMFTPGFTVGVAPRTALYFYSQIPVARDSNNNLVQETSYLAGVTHYYDIGSIF